MRLPKPGELNGVLALFSLIFVHWAHTFPFLFSISTVCGRLLPTKANKMEGKMLPALVTQLIGRFHEVSMR